MDVLDKAIGCARQLIQEILGNSMNMKQANK
jgi:hypothetical protein